MKKILSAAIALLFTVNLAMAQDRDDAKQPATTPGVETAKPAAAADAAPAKCDMKNCCIKRGGKMFSVKDGMETPMESDLTLANGTVVMKDGTCVGKDGKKMSMKDGECVDMHGKTCVMSQPRGKTDPAETK